jgi:D-glutamate cyclase
MYQFHENLDRAVTIEISPQGLARGIILKSYEHVRAGGTPLSYQIARALLDQPGSRVGFVTGLPLPPYLPHGEIDGLVGSAVLGHSLSLLDYPIRIITEESILPVMEGLLGILGTTGAELVNASEVVDSGWGAVAETLDVLIAVEKLGINRKGQRHLITGTPFEVGYAWADDLTRQMNARGRLTIGFADGGNEIGFGAIFDYARSIIPNGSDCGCPCGDGIVAATPTRYLFPAATSNFGAYGVAAALALQSGQLQLLPDPAKLVLLLQAALDAGCIDGGTGKSVLAEDGIPVDAAVGVLHLLDAIVRTSFQMFDRGF